jgi:hypothetical protein
MDILYRPLAEILLLHEFYVTDSKLASVFDVADQSARMAWLADNYDPGQPAITGDLLVTPDERTGKLLRNQHIRLVPTPWGFVVAIRVTRGVRPDTTTGYQPFIPFPANLSLVFLLQKSNLNLDGFTNSRLTRPLPALYYFSNQDCPDPKTFPYLANAIPAYDATYNYEMGELNLNGSTLQQATASGIAPPMTPVSDGGFISENDRLLLPLNVVYTFAATDTVTQATFTLTDANAQVIQTITAGSAAAGAALLQKVPLNFTAPADTLYTLEVTGSGGYSRQETVMLYGDAAELRPCWGVVELLPTVKTAPFDLIDSYGFLVPPAGGTAPDHPVFEIRIKSRLAYWRYNPNADGVTLAINADNTNYLVVSGTGPALVSKAPRICTYTPTLFTIDNINYDNLPNPVYGTVLAQSGNQYFKDIWVQKTDLFS